MNLGKCSLSFGSSADIFSNTECWERRWQYEGNGFKRKVFQADFV